jgi:Sec-independent protein translocase protein TatA
MLRPLHNPVEVIIEYLGVVVIFVEIILFGHLELKHIIRALLNLIKIIRRTLVGSLKIRAGTNRCKQDKNEEKLFHEVCEITNFR